MEVEIRAYTPADCPQAAALWNQIVEQGDSFPGDQPLSLPEADAFFRAQAFTGCAWLDGGGALYPAPQQHRAVRPYFQRLVRSGPRGTRQRDREAAGAPFPQPGGEKRLYRPAV